MCLIFVAIRQHPDYKLIVAANRDEFYERPTSPAMFWRDHPSILAGRDLVAGGTWLGISRAGRLAMVTNFRDPVNVRPTAPSRGELVTNFLLDSRDGEQCLQDVSGRAHLYNGFSLIAGDVDRLWYLSNYDTGLTPLGEGLYGLSNHLLETPWPKVEKGKRRLQTLLKSPELRVGELFDVLSDRSISDDAALPDTGVGKEWERLLSAAFIKTPTYGTRSSTVILVNSQGGVSFNERTYNHEKDDFEYRSYEFLLKPGSKIEKA
jgi:uncharacterized protein with NRDE domain